MMNFCRDSCINLKHDDITYTERMCLKNCSSKYLEQFSVLNAFQNDYTIKFGSNMFISNRENNVALNKLVEFIKFNDIQTGGATL